MKIPNTLVAILLLVFLFPSNGFSQYSKWSRDTVYNGIEFKKLRIRTDGHKSFYVNGVLKKPTKIEGILCHKQIWLDKDGNLSNFILSEEIKVVGHSFRNNTQIIHQGGQGYLIHCLYQPNIQGFNISRTPYRSPFFVGNSNFQLYPSGRLKYFQPTEVIEIDGIWCRPSPVRGGVLLYEDGTLKSCTSAKEQKIQGQTVGKNFSLEFTNDGKLIYSKKEKVFGDD